MERLSDPFYTYDRVTSLADAAQTRGSNAVPEVLGEGGGKGGGGTAAVTHAFKLSDATSAGTAQVKILFGMVNAITPTGMSAPSLTLSVGASGYVVLAVTTNSSGVATSAAISIAASVARDSATLGHIALGYVTKNTGPTSVTCSQSVSGSLWHQQCGATTHLFGSV